MRELSEAERITAGARVGTFLADAVIMEALKDLEELNHREFLAAETTEARTNAWAEARALARFAARLKSLREDGERLRKKTSADAK